MCDLLEPFLIGPPHDWKPQVGESVLLLLSGGVVVEGAIEETGERTHHSGNVERWYVVLTDEGQSIACSRNSIRPKGEQ